MHMEEMMKFDQHHETSKFLHALVIFRISWVLALLIHFIEIIPLQNGILVSVQLLAVAVELKQK